MKYLKKIYRVKTFVSSRNQYTILLLLFKCFLTPVFAQKNPIEITCGESVNEAKISLNQGVYKMYVKVFIDPGTSILGFKTSISSLPSELNWEFKDVTKGQWVTLSNEFTTLNPVMEQNFTITVLEDDYFGVGYGNFYVDDFYIENISNVDTIELEHVSVFPNPSSDLVNVTCPEGSEITVYNGLGASVINIQRAKKLNPVSISSLASGIYFVKIKNSGSQAVKKIIVK
ncbi:T9SS type A sorting domain-containing protein [Flavobacterium sp. PL002]|uniref:T9SS type A sorting domain-containing protein n=1 Tax=Flavobacterium sp. PL002 TaxID=1897058 RepID=UPI001787A4BC|nr:T9SS type A sorting domain-containing protein [Flavobacterium sp. PL002]